MINELLLLDTVALTFLYNRYINTKELSDYELRIGYRDYLLLKKPITIDMRITPHVLVCGLSGQGKSKMVEYMVKGKKIVLLNSYSDDFISLGSVRRINGNDEILKYFNSLLSNLDLVSRSGPLYIVIDELLTLCYDKKITQCILDILSRGRHSNVYIIGISQNGTKEVIKFKDLFNTRIAFRLVEESSYRAVLGYSPVDTKLTQQEFFLYSDRILRGFTYTI